MRVPPILSHPPATVVGVSCVEIGSGLQRLLDLLHREISAGRADLEPGSLAVAASYGWVYEHGESVALTGAGAYHAGSIRRRGMLGD